MKLLVILLGITGTCVCLPSPPGGLSKELAGGHGHELPGGHSKELIGPGGHSKELVGPGAHSMTQTHSAEVIDKALHDVDLYYNDHLCHELLMVNCNHHPITHDSKICGTDGVEYSNHCTFVHAKCRLLTQHNHVLGVTNHGPCTTQPPRTKAPTIKPPQTPVQSTMPPQTSSPTAQPQTPAQTTGPPSRTAQDTSATTPAVPTDAPTPNPALLVIKNVFCQHVGEIKCNGDLNLVCASNGQVYPNQCEFSKDKCVLNDLVARPDFSTCNPMP